MLSLSHYLQENNRAIPPWTETSNSVSRNKIFLPALSCLYFSSVAAWFFFVQLIHKQSHPAILPPLPPSKTSGVITIIVRLTLIKTGKGKERKESKRATSGYFQGHLVPCAEIKAPDWQGPGGSSGVSMGSHAERLPLGSGAGEQPQMAQAITH